MKLRLSTKTKILKNRLASEKTVHSNHKQKKAIVSKKANSLPMIEQTCEESEDIAANSSLDSLELTVGNSFFYTNDKFFESLDSNEIFNSICHTYTQLNLSNDDKTIKKELFLLFSDSEYITRILEEYNITILDLTSIICRIYGPLFKGMFLKKLSVLLNKYL